MNLTDLLESAGGTQSIARLAAQFGLDTADAGKLIGALSPALVKGMQRQAASPETRAGLERAIRSGTHQRYLDQPELLTREETREDGNGILGHLFGSKDVSRDVAARASQDTGLDASLIRKALPIVAALAMGTMGKKASAADEGNGGGLGALAGLLGGSDGKFDLDDVRNIVGKFF